MWLMSAQAIIESAAHYTTQQARGTGVLIDFIGDPELSKQIAVNTRP